MESRSPIEALVRTLVAWRVPLLIVGFVIGALAIPPAGRVAFDRSIENMFAQDDPLLVPYRMIKRTFGGNEIVMAAYVDPKLMTEEGIRRLDAFTKQLAGAPGVASVLSLSNGPLGLEVIDPELKPARAYAELFEGYLVGADRETAGVVCLLDPKAASRQSETVEAIRALTEAHDASGVVVGEPVMIVDGFRYLEEDGKLLSWVSTTLLVLTIVYCFRSLRWVIVPLAVVQLSLVGTQAILSLSGLRLSMVSSMLAAIITVIGVVKVIDLTVMFRDLRARGLAPREALETAGTRLATPIFWACVTDAAGFGALLAARAGPVNDFGLMMAIGSMVVLVAIALLVPGLALVGRFDPDPRRAWGEENLDHVLAGLSARIERHPRLLWTLTIVASVLAGLGCLRLKVETDFTKNFRDSSPVVRSYGLVEKNLGGAGVWDVVVPAPDLYDWNFIKRVRKLENRLREEITVTDELGATVPGLTKVVSAVDALDAFTPIRLDSLRFDALRRAAANAGFKAMQHQMPVFYGAIVGRDPEQDKRQFVRIMLRAKERQEAEAKRDIIAAVERITREEFPEGQVSGFFVLLTNLVISMTRDQWVTFALATAGIFLTMLLAFRSVPLALVSLVPNALPVFMVTGLFGWLGLKINMGAAMIAAVSMGLSVDSSTHYIAAFLDERGHGATLHTALRAVHQSVGRAMIFSTLALVVGFSALSLSQFVPTIYFGALVGLTMMGGLVGNLIVLPLLLAFVYRRDKTPVEPSSETQRSIG